MTEEELLRSAAQQAVVKFLQDITPRQVLNVVRLDDDDPALESIIETAVNGNVAQAAEDCRRFLESQPNHAGAAFNLAVFLDAMQQYDEAIQQYDHAMRLGSKPFYIDARSGCARRAASMAQVGSGSFNGS